MAKTNRVLVGDRILEVNHHTLLNLAHADVIAYLKEPVEVMTLKIRREAPSLDEQLRSTMVHASASAARLAPVAAVPVEGMSTAQTLSSWSALTLVP